MAVQQGIERVEKFFLCPVLAGEELDVIDEQRSGGTVMLFEGLDRVAAQRLDHFAHEVLRMQVNDPRGAVSLVNQVAGGVQQVRFSQTGSAVEQ